MSDINNTNDAVRVLWQRFDVIDGARQAVDSANANVDSQALHDMARDRKDGRISEDDLRAVAGHAGFTDEERAAAQYLLDHPDVLDSIDGADTGGNVDDDIGRQAVVDFIDANRGSLSYDMVAVADASSILGTGERGGEDDYDARATAFANLMEGLSESDRNTLMQEILRQDAGAPDSWLQQGRLDDLRQSGGISQAGFDAVSDTFAATPAGIEQFIEDTVVGHVEDYSQHAEELNWLIANLGPAMTPQRLQEAIDGYIADKGGQWQQQYEQYQQRAIADGQAILERLGYSSTQSLSPAQRQELADTIFKDHPEAQTAILLALGEPGRVDAQTLDGAMGFFDGVELSGKAPELANVLGQAYLERVRAQIEAVDPNNPQTIDNARNAIEGLRNSHYADLLNLPEGRFNTLIDTLNGTVPEPGMTVSQMEGRLQAFANAADDLDAAANGASVTQGLRVLGLTAGAIGLYSSGSQLFDDPNPETALRGLTDLVGLSSSATEVLVGAGALQQGGRIASTLGSPVLGKVLGAAGLVFGGIDLYRNVRDGDAAQAGLTVAGMGGAALAAFGTASWAGPVGIGIGALAAAGSIGLNQWRRVDASNEHMNEVSREFLQHAGLNEDVAGALVDQSGEGYSPVPFLFEYAASRGLNQAQTIAWLNSLDGDDLESIRDRAHEVLDSIDGDLSKLDGDSDPEVLEFLSGYGEAEDRGDVYTHDQGNGFTIDTEYRQIVAGTWEEFSAVLSAKDRPLPTV